MSGIRTEQEIIAKIRELRQAWREVSAADVPSLQNIRLDIASQMQSLYWCLGQNRQQAIDSAEVALGGDPIDWS